VDKRRDRAVVGGRVLGGVRDGLRLCRLAGGISRIGANRVLVYQYLITLVGVASGIVFFGETLGVEKLVGGVVILLGVYLARRQ
jgi:drug/metabolite transporter (DMT)-like permease